MKHNPAKAVPIYQLKITLADVEPPIWRRLSLRGDMSLGLLHAVIQVAMGWTNSHLHHFIIGKERYADPAINEDRCLDEKPDSNEWKTALMEVMPQAKLNLIYEYDFGDSWQHVVEVEKIHAADALSDGFVKCLDGARACPPDDCGGVGGYENLLEAIKDPKHEEHESLMEWLGRPFDPEAFDPAKTNQYLKKLKWPRVTEDQLARVLMARDGCRG